VSLLSSRADGPIWAPLRCEAAGPEGADSSKPLASAIDVSASASLLMEAVLACNESAGLARPIKLLCGSNSKDVFDSQKKVQSRGGGLLHGAGDHQDRAWWNVRSLALLNTLVHAHSHTHRHPRIRTHTHTRTRARARALMHGHTYCLIHSPTPQI
jgi:hypothetical protein